MDENMPIKSKHFMAYRAFTPIDPRRPWQIISRIGAICGKLATREQASAAVFALDKDKDAGTLPNNLAEWDKANLLTSHSSQENQGDPDG